MKTSYSLNLSEGLEFFPKSNLNFEKFKFPGGEVHIKFSINENIVSPEDTNTVLISSRLNNSDDLMTLALAVDALRRFLGYSIVIHLYLPYLPYARQDRVMVPGEPLSIKVIGNILNSLNVEQILSFDVHSSVAEVCINNFYVISNVEFLKAAFTKMEVDIASSFIICPDGGAKKKIFPVLQEISFVGQLAVCDKARELSSGKILHTDCDVVDFEGKNVFIIDDICDGGMTFIKIAELLKTRNVGEITLIVSHGIFSKGLDVLYDAGIDRVVTTTSRSNFEEYEIDINDGKLIIID